MLASVIGGFYSLIILFELPSYISVLSKIAAACLIILAAFRFYNIKSFLLTSGIFLFSNFIFLGIIVGVCLLSKTPLIEVNNQSVYFDISARGLLLSSFLAYLISCVVVRIYNRRLSVKERYTVVIENCGQSVRLSALMDTGNRLREPFSGAPVIVADGDMLKGLYSEEKLRIIPSSSLGGSAFLKAFKPERVYILTDKGKEVSDKVYIALSDNIKGDYSAILHPEILSI